MKRRKRLDNPGSIKKLKTLGDKLVVPIIVTVVGGLILNYITYFPISKIDVDNASPNSTVSNNTIHENSTFNDAIPSGTMYDNTMSNDNPANDIILDDMVPNDVILDDIIFDSTMPNGTMPKGTSPKDIPISEEMEEILGSIKKLSIGSSKNWIDDKLGPPFSSNIVEVTVDGRVGFDTDESSIVGELLECVYMFDSVSVIVYFDTHDYACQAFFITLMEDIMDIDIVMPEVYSTFVSYKPLGEFTFADIDGDVANAYGYVSNGVGRVFYGERYYFMGSGNYQDFYFAILDYGMLDSLGDFDNFLSKIQFDIGPADDIYGYTPSDLLIQQRKKLYPNTYGISTLNYELTFDLFSDYTGFDSAAFRKRD